MPAEPGGGFHSLSTRGGEADDDANRLATLSATAARTTIGDILGQGGDLSD